MLERLAKAAYTFPCIDNHAHNILCAEKDPEFPLQGLAGEAAGEAANDIRYTLPFMRATKQLAALYDCERNWDAVLDARSKLSYQEICEKCFKPSGIQCLLLDDLMIGIQNNCVSTRLHDVFTRSPTKRIIRLESVAEDIIAGYELTQNSTAPKGLWSDFQAKFVNAIESYCKDPEVVGFKSVACYRTGLDISDITIWKPEPEKDFDSITQSLAKVQAPSRPRLASKFLNDALVCHTLKAAGNSGKPVQFHTGLGDNDIMLSKANPALMQPIIKAYPDTTFVILHSSYPFTQEAGYLTSVYKNVYLDFGEIWPFVSGDGQRQVIRQLLELCPTSKLLWSTDGHYWPETYYLGSLQSRQAIYEVLASLVLREEITEQEAFETVERVLFHNSNHLYKLNLEPIPSSETNPFRLDESQLSLLPSDVREWALVTAANILAKQM